MDVTNKKTFFYIFFEIYVVFTHFFLLHSLLSMQSADYIHL